MESTEISLSPKKLLTRFGIMCWVLPYYGYFDDWKVLLLTLSVDTKNHWNKYKNAYLNVWKYEEFLVMIYSKSFNEEFRNYLTNWTKSNGINSSDSKIKRYHASKVIISLSNESSLKWFYSNTENNIFNLNFLE